jgi:hypothetical protein
MLVSQILIFRLISNVGNFKSFSMMVTKPGSLLYWCLMKRADLFNMIFLIWIPGTTCVFNIRSYFRLRCSFLYFFWEFADISKLVNWAWEWQMKFNASKCYVLRITNKKKPVLHNYTMHDQVLENVDQNLYFYHD